MIKKLLTVGAIGLVLTVAGCRNPDDRKPSATSLTEKAMVTPPPPTQDAPADQAADR